MTETTLDASTSRAARWALLGALATAAYLLIVVDRHAALAEDAAILMRYSQHLGQGLGYVWNPGQPPVDGATDWLGTTLLGGLYAAGLPLEQAPRFLAGAAHALTVALMIGLSISAFGAPVPVALASAAVVAAGSARAYVEAGFLTTIFGLGVLAGWGCIATAAAKRKGAWPYWFALAMLATTLARPEGIAVTAFMIAAALFVLDPAEWRRFVRTLVVVFVPLFALFVLWRWQYFGRLLPLPFLKKGGGRLHWDGLIYSLRGVVVLLGWALPLLTLGLRPGKPLRWLSAMTVVVGGYASMWVLLSPEMDYVYRFQYALVPLVAASWPVLWSGAWPQIATAARVLSAPVRAALAAALLVMVAAAVGWQHHRFDPGLTATGLKDAGLLLNRYGGKRNVVVTTEAGLIPLHAGWQAIDAWGLNDPRVVQEGGMTERYLAEADPDVIMFHALYTPLSPRTVSQDEGWDRMVATLHRFAVCRGYSLAAVYGPGFGESHYYFVKPSWENAAAFTTALRAVSYRWWGVSTPLTNLAAFETVQPDCD